MSRVPYPRALAVLAAAAIGLSVFAATRPAAAPGLPFAAQELRGGVAGEREFEGGIQGLADGGAASESVESYTAALQWAQARTAPGIVDPGAYTSAYAALSGLPTVGGAWDAITNVPFDADDPDYRDYYSNSSGGAGLVTGRVTALAADDDGFVYAGGANGGVWRSSTGGGSWTPIADSLPTLSSGDLQLDRLGRLWYATGEANTGGTTYVGSGVYRLNAPRTGTFSTANRVGGTELESTTINAIRFAADDTVWIATLRGIYVHPLTGNGPWQRVFAPNPSFLPGGSNAGDPNAPYKNIVNDIAVDPNDPDHVIAAVGWRSGDTYNGFYQTRDGGATWRKVNLRGGLDKDDIGNASFAWAADGSKLYVMNQSPKRINNLSLDTVLDGVFVSKSGRLGGPWTRIASPGSLATSSSALSKWYGIGYRPGVQAWYNQLLMVDPGDPDHVIAGLEEVYETRDGGAHWTTIGPYWNFYFGCWRQDSVYPPNGAPNRCPQTTHADQHAAAVGTSGGTTWLFIGNDGGIYKRPLNGGRLNRNGNATDWQSLNDGTIDTLQYYAIGVGPVVGDDGDRPDIDSGDGVLVSGGLQDNGGSLVRPGAAKVVSNFGGDGGDVLVDPADGCNIVQEYVFLSMRVTQTCANPGPDHPNAFLDLNDATTYAIAPPDVNARFIAPFGANASDIDEWVAGGNSLWFQDNGFAIRSGSEWERVYTFGSVARVATAVAFDGDTIVAGWCGTCNNAGFQRGLVVGRRSGGSWTFTEVVPPSNLTTLPNRYIAAVAIDPEDEDHLLVGLNGFSRRFTEGPGAGIGHVFESFDAGATWSLADAGTFPDIPVNSLRFLPSGGVVAGTDLAVLHRADGAAAWKRLGTGFPATTAIDVEYSATDDMVYVGTHGRGIWRIPAAGL